MSLRILVVDDHDVVRQGVRLILRKQTDWQICGEAENGAEALEKDKKLRPDIIILDVSMPLKDGLEVIAELRTRCSAARVLVLTMHSSKELSAALKAAGAKGYIIKSHAARDLVKAIRTIIDGGDFFKFDPEPAKPDKREDNSPLFSVGMAGAFA